MRRSDLEPIVGDLVTSETEAIATTEPIADLVPHEAPPQSWGGDPNATASFPKVLRRRLDQFFVEAQMSPKADGAMWAKIATGLSVLVGSWIAIYWYRPDSWRFVGLYVL